MAFVPSHESFNNPAKYGDAGGSGASAKPTSSGATTRSGSASIPAGTYSDPDGYSYTIGSGSITIYKKDGSVWKTLSPSSMEWDTVVSNLAADRSANKLKSGKATPTAAPAKTYSPASSYSPPATTPPPAAEESLTDKVWFWPAVAVSTVAAVGGGYWFFFMRGGKGEVE